jgi:hypothetical protein
MVRLRSSLASAALLALVCLAPSPVRAQLQPGRIYVMPQFGPLFATGELLRAPAVYSTPRPTDPDNPVITDIRLDPGLLLGGRLGYAVTRRLLIEAQLDWGVSVLAIRQLEIMDDTDMATEPQYETTTLDAHIIQYGIGLSYFVGGWKRVQPFLTAGFGDHSVDLRRKGAVDPDPVRDRYIAAGVGLAIHATNRLTVRVDVRDFMYNFRFDNQFVDPELSRLILFRREEFYRTTSVAGDKFQNDLALSLAFMVQTF